MEPAEPAVGQAVQLVTERRILPSLLLLTLFVNGFFSILIAFLAGVVYVVERRVSAGVCILVVVAGVETGMVLRAHVRVNNLLARRLRRLPCVGGTLWPRYTAFGMYIGSLAVAGAGAWLWLIFPGSLCGLLIMVLCGASPWWMLVDLCRFDGAARRLEKAYTTWTASTQRGLDARAAREFTEAWDQLQALAAGPYTRWISSRVI